jgi:putative methyltransferase (TIGR04325 family)
LSRALYRREFARNTGDQLFLGHYASFDEAIAAAPTTRPVGYDNAGSVGRYAAKVTPRDYPALFWLGRVIDSGARHVFDLGGHTGIKYLAFRRLLHVPDALRWTVCEVPALVAEGRRLAEAEGAEAHLHFTTERADLAAADVLFASGSVQFIEESPGAMLSRLGLRPRWVVLNTSAVHPTLSYITLNSIGSAYCPYRVQSRDSLVAELEALGYHLRDEWQNAGKGLHVPFHPELDVPHYRGFCFELRPA